MSIKEVSLADKQTCGCLVLRSFVLKQKNQKFKNAGSPPGGIQPSAPAWRSGKWLFIVAFYYGSA
ncbi:MAG: hypothetical protein EOP42_01325 [Sphingobacteriaceae bacterium]|nr:MAG: hypothetical protein EOP42_01325 [Sphingobacteriaceae bacterium]